LNKLLKTKGVLGGGLGDFVCCCMGWAFKKSANTIATFDLLGGNTNRIGTGDAVPMPVQQNALVHYATNGDKNG
jgi:hypothetical protein